MKHLEKEPQPMTAGAAPEDYTAVIAMGRLKTFDKYK